VARVQLIFFEICRSANPRERNSTPTGTGNVWFRPCQEEEESRAKLPARLPDGLVGVAGGGGRPCFVYEFFEGRCVLLEVCPPYGYRSHTGVISNHIWLSRDDKI
jgi:hypothetical protein